MAELSKFRINGVECALKDETARNSGGYYTPAVSQLDASTMRIRFNGSNTSMPNIAAKDITLPSGANYVLTEEDKTEIAGMAAELVEIPDSGGNVDLTGYATEQFVRDGYQPKGDYLTEVPEGYAKTEDIPTKPEDIGAQPTGNYLTEVPSGYATEEFVKNKIAEAELGVEEVDLSGYAQKSELPTKVSQLENDSGYLTAVPDGYAKTEDIPKNAADIGAQPEGDYALRSEIPSVPVQSVNGKTGAVQLSAADVKAKPENWMPTAQEVGALPNTYTPPNQTAEQVGADPKGTAASAVSQHNASDDSHSDIRLELKAINDRLTAFFDSDNQTLDELSEIVAYITSNKSLIDSITTSKVSVADIINNLTSNVTNKPLSAAQGVVLKGLIDTLSGNLANYQPKGDYALRSELPNVPTKLSEFTNDSGFITGYTETDPTVPAWAKQPAKPTYTAAEVGALPSDTVIPTVPTKVSAFTNDAGYLKESDKPDIVAMVIESLGGNPIFGIVDADNHIILNGDLPDGTYSVKYEMEDGSTVSIGNLVLDTNVYYTVTNNLTNCTNSNSATKAVQGESYSATITAKSGYELKSATVTMGGSPVTVSGGVINIANVTGNIVITAVAEEKVVEPSYTNFADPTSADWQEGYRLSLSGGNTSALAGHIVTNYIPCKAGDVLRVKGFNIVGTLSSNGTGVQNDAKILSFDTNKGKLVGGYGAKTTTSSKYNYYDEAVTVDGDISTYTIMLDNAGKQLATASTAFIRIDGALMNGYTKNDVIITVNEEIV